MDLEARLDAAASAPAGVGVLFLDLDRFKQVNDVLGHRTGDRLLVAVAGRLRAAVPPQWLVARFGGDEFVVVCPGADEATLDDLVARIQRVFDDPFAVALDPLHVSASIGAACAGPPIINAANANAEKSRPFIAPDLSLSLYLTVC